MLIIAIPKSASTSLMDTLGKVCKMPAQQLFKKELSKPKELPILSNLHSDMREYSSKEIDIFTQNNKIYKQHIPPTENNLLLLRDKKKVILLRNCDEIISAYWRAENSGIHSNFKKIHNLEVSSKEEWIKASRKAGLYDDLKFFYKGWLKESNSKNCLTVSYNELIQNPKKVINEIEFFFDLPITNHSIELSKKRYSRVNFLVIFFRKTRLKSKLINILKITKLYKPAKCLKNFINFN